MKGSANPGSPSRGPRSPLVLRIDGAARGNPGPAAAGYVIEDASGRALSRRGRLLGRATNNEAEYLALIAALDEAHALGAEEVEVRTDSELLERQLTGLYRLRAPNLKPLFEKAREALALFRSARILHVRREENMEADRLASRALDAGADVSG